jgi:hypothetical protein
MGASSWAFLGTSTMTKNVTLFTYAQRKQGIHFLIF